jgi:FKBP-type peptidyl-prolyl cis-trans isomerase
MADNTNGLIVEDIELGTGEAIKSGDEILIHYSGTLEDGTEFDSSYSRNDPLEIQIGVGQVIKGWDEGIIGLKVGGKRKLTIPSDLAYGDGGIPGVIPPKATLIFNVELVNIL